MADENHLRIIKQGVKIWNQWRFDNPQIRPDLSNVNLMKADLPEAYLFAVDLRNANLRGAKLRGSYMNGVDLRGADLREADLVSIDLLDADLRGAKLMDAWLFLADIRNAKLDGADFSNALIGLTAFGPGYAGVRLNASQTSNISCSRV